jgi:hypothetical protein
MNLFCETIGLAFTVIIIDQLVKANEKLKVKPARYAMFRDVYLIYQSCISLLQTMVNEAFDPNRDQEIIGDKNINFFDSRIGKIIFFLNLENAAPAVPKRSWRAYLTQQASDIEQKIDRCLQRYSIFMDPELIHILQNLERTDFLLFSKLLTTIAIVDGEKNITRSPHFGFGRHDSDLFPALKNLGEFLNKNKNEFKGMPNVPDEIDLKRSDFFDHLRSKISPTS